MSDNCFVDTNVLVYARDSTEGEKQPLAAAWLRELWLNRAGRISVQVLSEYYVTVTAKLKPGLSREDAWKDVTALFSWEPLAANAALLELAHRIQEQFGFSWWDAMIVAAAQTADCSFLLSEDLQAGQDLGGLVVVNPFHASPREILGR